MREGGMTMMETALILYPLAVFLKKRDFHII